MASELVAGAISFGVAELGLAAGIYAGCVRIGGVVAGLVLVLALVSGCGIRPAATPGSTGLAVGDTKLTISVTGVERSFTVHRPAAAMPESGYSLVVMLHGGLGSAAQAEASYGWDDLADQQGFLVVYPDGLDRTWNAGTCCGAAARDGVDDVAFLSAVLQRVDDLILVDPKRRYLTGMSNGAMMSYRMACETDLFAAVAPVSGTQLVDCAGAKPVSLLHIHGAADATVRLDGKRGKAPGLVVGPPIAQVVDGWRERDGCAAFTTSAEGAVTSSTAACPDARTVEWIVIAGAGHQWPGSVKTTYPGADPPAEALSATQVVWKFFSSHPRS